MCEQVSEPGVDPLAVVDVPWLVGGQPQVADRPGRRQQAGQRYQQWGNLLWSGSSAWGVLGREAGMGRVVDGSHEEDSASSVSLGPRTSWSSK